MNSNVTDTVSVTQLQQIQNSLARAVVRAPKSSHTTPILCSLHWLKINERIEYKLLSLTCNVLTTTQPSYLHNLIAVQPPRSTRSSSLVTLARPSTSSSLRITDCSFQYASPRLWNQLPAPLHQPRCNLSNPDSPSSFEWHFLHRFHRLTTLITHHPFSLSFQAKNIPFLQVLPIVAFLFFFRSDSMDSLNCLLILLSMSVFHFSTFQFLVPCGRISWVMLAIECTLNNISNRIAPVTDKRDNSIRLTRRHRHTHTHYRTGVGDTTCLQCFDAVGWASGRASGL